METSSENFPVSLFLFRMNWFMAVMLRWVLLQFLSSFRLSRSSVVILGWKLDVKETEERSVYGLLT